MGATGSKDASVRSGSRPSIHTKNKPQDLVDFGTVFPNGLYTTTPQDFDSRVLRKLILTKKLSPFYQGLPDAPEQVAAPLSSPEQPSISPSVSPSSPLSLSPQGRPMGSCPSRNNNQLPQGEPCNQLAADNKTKTQQKAMLYNDAVECPICFLYYPPNINYSRCCEQPICTECFIQIHRPTDDPSNPATCPFCLESNYGVTYNPPFWTEKNQTNRARSLSSSSSVSTTTTSPSSPTGARHTTSGISDEFKPRRKSVNHTHPDVVLIDHIRPHWNKPTTTSSRSSRRNSLTTGQHTSSPSGRNLLRAVTRPGRSASSAASNEYNQHWANVRDMNMDLEEWMVMEAIRLSLAEQHNSNDEDDDHSATLQQQDEDEEDDDDQPLAERVNHYQQVAAVSTTASGYQQQQQQQRNDNGDDILSSSSSSSSTTSSLSSQDAMDRHDHAADKKSTSEHEPPSATPGPDMVC